MHAIAILNKDCGTLKTYDLPALRASLATAFENNGHTIDIRTVAGREVYAALTQASESKGADTVIAGGGDGTVSAAAGCLWKTGKALGVLPAGTMNLFARSIGVPLDLEEACLALAASTPVPADLATANGKPFVHQFSVGLQPRVVRERERGAYRSRLGKIVANVRATLSALMNAPRFPATVTIDGARSEEFLSVLAISNNIYGEGHMPFADRIDTGELGIGTAPPLPPADTARLASDLLTGSWKTNPHFRLRTGKEVELSFKRLKRSDRATIDGELIPLERTVTIRMHHHELLVLRPEEENPHTGQ